jgi:hypothetical protein
MKILIDTNIFLEIILWQERAPEARNLQSHFGKACGVAQAALRPSFKIFGLINSFKMGYNLSSPA